MVVVVLPGASIDAARPQHSDYYLGAIAASFVRGWPVEYELGDLSALDPGAVRALGAALKLKGDAAHRCLGHTLLTEIAQLTTVEYRARRVEVFRLDLNRVLEVDVEGVARAVREELGVVLG